MSLLQEAEAILQRRKAERLAAVEDLAARQAAGDVPDPAFLVEVTEAAGVTLEDYGKRVAHRETRARQLAIVARQAELERQRDEAQRTMDDCRAKVAAYTAEQDAIFHPAQATYEIAKRQLGQIAEARGILGRTCLDPAINGRLKEIDAEHGPARNRLITLRQRQRQLSESITRYTTELSEFQEMRVMAAGGGVPGFVGEITTGDMSHTRAQKVNQELQTLQSEFDRNAPELAKLETEVPALEAERQALLVKGEQSPL